MKKLFLTMVFAAAMFTTSANAEVTDCQEILSVPVTITTQGVHCFKSDKVSTFQGNLIDIQANNVTIDMNGFKLGGSQAGAGTTANGIFAIDRKNITIRNGTIRGFGRGVFLEQSTGTSSGHLVEDLLLDQNRFIGIAVQGSGHVIRNNRMVNTGGGASANAFGILVNSASNTVIADNVVSGTSETVLAAGIALSSSALIEVRGNTILDTKDAATKRGIEIQSSTAVTVIDNRILNPAPFTFTFNLDEGQVVGGTGSAATGTGTATLNAAQDTLTYNITLTGLDLDGLQTPIDASDDVTAMHYHNAPPGVNGGIVFGLISPNHDTDDLVINPRAGTLTGAWENTDVNPLSGQLANLIAGDLYLNTHTTAFPGGEIRGQVLPDGGTGTTGVVVTGTSNAINCIDNTIFGFVTAFSGCDFEAGNNPPPPGP